MNPTEKYKQVEQDHREASKRPGGGQKEGQKLREAALDRAERRVWAHKRRGDEGRWAE